MDMPSSFPTTTDVAVELAPRKHPVDDPPPTTPHPVAPVDEPKPPGKPVDDPEEEEETDT
jgi:hypothetical protein